MGGLGDKLQDFLGGGDDSSAPAAPQEPSPESFQLPDQVKSALGGFGIGEEQMADFGDKIGDFLGGGTEADKSPSPQAPAQVRFLFFPSWAQTLARGS